MTVDIYFQNRFHISYLTDGVLVLPKCFCAMETNLCSIWPIHVVVTGSPNITRPKIDLRKKVVMFTQPLQNLPSIVGGMLHEIFGDSHVCLLHLGGAKCIYIYMYNIFNSHV